MTKNKHKQTPPTKAPHPFCKDCGYNLTGLSTPDNNLYTCPECGGFTNTKNASHLPWYIGPTKLPILITTIPPSMTIAALNNSQIPQHLNPRPLAITAAATLTWFTLIALIIAYKTARYKGPHPNNQPSTPTKTFAKTFTKITLHSIYYFAPVLTITWLILTATRLGAFQI